VKSKRETGLLAWVSGLLGGAIGAIAIKKGDEAVGGRWWPNWKPPWRGK
jgi:hypothetical protein